MMERRQLCKVVTVLVAFFYAAVTSWAGPTTDSWIARFEAPEQSMWSQGGSPVKSEGAAYATTTSGVLKGTRAGVEYGASLGTVAVNVEGRVEAYHPGGLSGPGLAGIGLSWDPIANESQIRTNFGAKATAVAELRVDMPWPIPDIRRDLKLTPQFLALEAKEDFTTGLGQQARASTDYELGAIGVDIYLAGAKSGFTVDQDFFFEPHNISGLVNYVHLDTMDKKQEPFSLYEDGEPDYLNLDLDKPGWWQVTVGGLAVDNTFSADMGVGWFTSVEAWLLGEFASKDVSFSLWTVPEFSLLFDEIQTLGKFNIFVDKGGAPGPFYPNGAPAVPVPGAMWLVGSGLLLLTLGRRRCQHLD